MHPLLAALALLLDRIAPALDATRDRGHAARYLDLMREQFGDLLALGPLVGVLFLVAVPVALAALLLWLAHGLGGVVATLVGLALVALALGPRSALRLLEAYPEALERDDQAGADAAARALGAAPAPVGDPALDAVRRSLAATRVMPQRLHDAALAPAFWCLLAGPVGAVAWRAAHDVERALAAAPERFAPGVAGEARRVLGVFGWLPTRAVALAFAAMGRSELAFAEWRVVRAAQRVEQDAEPEAGDLRGRDELLLAQVADAALRVRPDEEDQGLHLAWSMVALAERAWLTAIAALIAAGALIWIA